MKKVFLSLAVASLVAAGTYAQAGGECPAGAKKAASGSCASACSGAEKVAATESDKLDMAKGGADEKAASAACAAACSGDKVATSEADKLEMAKGGAEDSSTATGYTLGKKVPSFTRTDAAGKEYTLGAGNPTVLVFYNHQCPFVVEVNDRLSDFTKTYSEKGVNVWAIDSGINNSKEEIAKIDEKYAFPVLIDNSSELAVNFAATRTPEVFVLDKEGVIQYHGMFDTGQNVEADGSRKTYAKDAVDALLAGKDVEVKQTKAFGCTIKFNPDAKKTASAGEGKKEWKKDKVAAKDPLADGAKSESGATAY